MKLTICLKLRPTPDQHAALLATLERANEAANQISTVAWQQRTFRQYDLHRLVYYDVRAASGLSAQMVVRVVAKVADAYKPGRTVKRVFRPHGGIAYDDRILSYHADSVSIWTVTGRQHVPFVASEQAWALLTSRRGESDLIYRNGKWLLYAAVDLVTPDLEPSTEVLGVDIGIVNLAADSDGTTYAGGQVNGLRARHARLRQRLQAKGTRAARRLLRKRRYKEQRFARQVNHMISKRLVATAKGTKRAIALEDLTHIRSRITARQPQRRHLHAWAFADLRAKIEYKARLAGVPVLIVDPRNTSRTCPACGHVAAENRPTRARFSCVRCGHAGPADTIAAVNLAVRGRAAVNQPHSAGDDHAVVS